MVKEAFDDKFKKSFKKLDKPMKDKVIKQFEKIRKNPEIGKPLKYTRKKTREVYIKPYRLAYAYEKAKDLIRYLDIYHKDEQ